MKVQFIEKSFPYTGQELRHLFAYEKFGLAGDSIVAWTGSCQISLDDMIDGEDKFENSQICGDQMLHFIGEFFQPSIYFAVSFQRLFASICAEELYIQNPSLHGRLTRSGDDLYVGEKKLSISIATIGHFSSMIHFALNITNEGTPVPTCALSDFQVDPSRFAKAVLERAQNEYQSIVFATQKVRSI